MGPSPVLLNEWFIDHPRGRFDNLDAVIDYQRRPGTGTTSPGAPKIRHRMPITTDTTTRLLTSPLSPRRPRSDLWMTFGPGLLLTLEVGATPMRLTHTNVTAPSTGTYTHQPNSANPPATTSGQRRGRHRRIPGPPAAPRSAPTPASGRTPDQSAAGQSARPASPKTPGSPSPDPTAGW
jgi:hypothetical protein